MKYTDKKFLEMLLKAKKICEEFPNFDALTAVQSGDAWEHLDNAQKRMVEATFCPVVKLAS
ncbi:MAG: hypothetical protein ACXAC5_02685 [Promethearchaeota archaeon]